VKTLALDLEFFRVDDAIHIETEESRAIALRSGSKFVRRPPKRFEEGFLPM
jgi:hypothetical protein